MKALQKQLRTDLTRAARLFVIVLPLSVVCVAIVVWANPRSSFDQITTGAAVPLMVSYLMIRVVMWFASGIPEITDEQKLALEESQNAGHAVQLSNFVAFLVIAFVFGMWCVVSGAISAAIYLLLGMNGAFLMAISIIKWILIVVAATAVVLCLIRLCRTWLLKIARVSHQLFNNPFPFIHGRA